MATDGGDGEVTTARTDGRWCVVAMRARMAVTGMAAATAAMAAAAAETTIAHEIVLAAMAIAHGIGGPAGEGGRWMAGVGGGEGRTSMEAAASRSPRPTGGSTRGCYASSMAARGRRHGRARLARGQPRACWRRRRDGGRTVSRRWTAKLRMARACAGGSRSRPVACRRRR